MALSYALDTPKASFAKKRRSASVVTASPFCFRISQSGELSVFYHKIPSALYKKSVQNNSSYKYL